MKVVLVNTFIGCDSTGNLTYSIYNKLRENKIETVKPQLLQAHRWCWCRSAEIRSHAGFLRSSRCG